MSGPQVVAGATMMCSFGLAPSTLAVLPVKGVLASAPSANIADMVAIATIPPFGACTSLANPTVASATSAALGVLTPMPCVPVPAGTWLPGNTKVMIKGPPATDVSCKLMCSWGGVIQVLNPGQFKVMDV